MAVSANSKKVYEYVKSVGDEDQRAVRALRDGGGHLFQHQVRVAVADDLVAQQVQHQIVVRRHIGKDKAGVALIHFQHDVIRREPDRRTGSRQQSASGHQRCSDPFRR